MNTAPQSESVIELQNVTKRFDHITALSSVDLAVRKGECLVIVGPSGAGKTTLLRTIAGLEQADTGTVLLEGQNVNEVGPWARRVGMTFENYALYPHLSVRDNIAFPLRSQSPRSVVTDASAIEARIRKIAEILGIDELLDRQTDQLSGGQRQRVSLARCLVRDAAAFLLDEPLAHLDAKLRMSMRAEFKRMVRRLDATIVYVTHDYREALALGDRIVVIQDGVIVQVGTQDEVFEQPSTLFVAQFVGNPTMNIVDGFIDDGFARIGSDKNGSVVAIGPVSSNSGQPVPNGPVKIGFRPMDCFSVSGSSGGMIGSVRAVKVQQDATESALIETAFGVVEATINTVTRPDYGDTLEIRIDPERVLVFDTQTERLVGGISAANKWRC